MDFDRIIHDAVTGLHACIYELDVKEIDGSAVHDVIAVARDIEREREQRESLCNLRRVETLLKELQRLGDFFQGLPRISCPLNYIWGPVKLALEIANKEDAALEAVLSGYHRLTSSLRFLHAVTNLPQSDKIRLQEVAVYTFCDVLDYHGRVLQALRRGGWQLLFDASWSQLRPTFDCIVQRLDRTRLLVEQTVARRPNTYEEVNISGNATAHLGDQVYEIQHAIFAPPEDFAAAQQFRDRMLEDLARKQKQEQDRQFDACIKWLDLQDLDKEQGNLFTRRRDAREEATCEWILSHSKMKAWLDPDFKRTFLWLKGKPGKTTLATYIIDNTKLPNESLMLYYLCARETSPNALDVLNVVLSILAAQVLRKKQHLVPFVYETYVKTAEQLALKLPTLVRQLLSCLPTTFIVIDGLDECDVEAQSRLYNKLEWIISARRMETPAGPEVKILICSQDTKGIPTKLHKQTSISLSAEQAFISRDVKVYTRNSVISLRDRFGEELVEDIVTNIVAKANGMFLWAKLVLQTVLEQESLLEIQDTLHSLPAGLTGVYLLLLNRMKRLALHQKESRIRMIFYWLLFAHRPMKAWEMCDALVIGGSNLVLVKNYTILLPSILDICKPLIEVLADGTASLVHFSVKDFLLDTRSGPFIHKEDALTHINTTCLRYLFTCEDFFLGNESTKTYREIIMLMHGLFLYVVEAWKVHFAALVSATALGSHNHEVMLSELTKPDVVNDVAQSPRNAWSSSRPRPDLIALDNEVVRSGILESLKETNAGASDDRAPFSLQHDPVRQAFTSFQKQSEKALDNQCPFRLDELNVSDIDLQQFQQRYAAAAFLCRWSNCLRSTNGFPSSAERHQHEQMHQKQFCCPQPDCEFMNSGFTSRTALKNHVRRYHIPQKDMDVPKLRIHKRASDYSMSRRPPRERQPQQFDGRVFDTFTSPAPTSLSYDGFSNDLAQPREDSFIAFNCCRCGRTTYDSDSCNFGDCTHRFCSSCIVAELRGDIDPSQPVAASASSVSTPAPVSPAFAKEGVVKWLSDSTNFPYDPDPSDIGQPESNPETPDIFRTTLDKTANRRNKTANRHNKSTLPPIFTVMESASHSDQITNSWSNSEVKKFGDLYGEYGCHFVKIAELLKTKTPKMVESKFHDIKRKTPVMLDYWMQLHLLQSQNKRRLASVRSPPDPSPIVSPFLYHDQPELTLEHGDSSIAGTGSEILITEHQSGQRQANSFASLKKPATQLQDSAQENVVEEKYTVKCICEYDDDDGNTVFCQFCNTWQHIECFYPKSFVPDIHLCQDCAPEQTAAGIYPDEARERQQRTKEEHSLRTSEMYHAPKEYTKPHLADAANSRSNPAYKAKSRVVNAMSEDMFEVPRPGGLDDTRAPRIGSQVSTSVSSSLPLPEPEEDFEYVGSDGFRCSIQIDPSDRTKFSMRMVQQFPASPAAVCVLFSPDNSHIAVGYNDKVTIGDIQRNDLTVLSAKSQFPFKGNPECCCFSPDGKNILIADDTFVTIWNVKRGIDQSRSYEGPVSCLNYSPDGALIAVGSSVDSVKLLDAQAFGPSRIKLSTKHPVVCVAFSPTGNRIAAGLSEGRIAVWDRFGTPIAACNPRDTMDASSTDHLFFLRSDARLCRCRGSMTRVWSFGEEQSGSQVMMRCVKRTAHWPIDVHCAALSVDGGWLISGMSPNEIRFWDPGLGHIGATLKFNAKIVYFARHPSDRVLAIVFEDGTIRLWRYGEVLVENLSASLTQLAQNEGEQQHPSPTLVYVM